MKRKVPSPPPPPLPPAKPRRAGALNTPRSAGKADGKADINDRGRRKGGGGGGRGNVQDNHHHKGSIPIPPPTLKYKSTNPSTMSPVYHLVYDLTSPPSPQSNQTASIPSMVTTSNNNNHFIPAFPTTHLDNASFSTSAIALHPNTSVKQETFSSPCFPTHLASLHEDAQIQVDLDVPAWDRGRVGRQDGLQVKSSVSERGTGLGQRSEEENDTSMRSTCWGNPASGWCAPPAPSRTHCTGSREVREAISAVNGDSGCPPPLPPPRSTNLANSDAAHRTNRDRVTGNCDPLLSDNNYPTQHSQVSVGYNVQNSWAYFKNGEKHCPNNENKISTSNTHPHLSHLVSYNSTASVQAGRFVRDRSQTDGDRSQVAGRAGEGGEGGAVWRGARAEFSSEAPSFHPFSVRHELKTADATSISTSVTPRSNTSCVLPVLPEQQSQTNFESRSRFSEVCLDEKGPGIRCHDRSVAGEAAGGRYELNNSRSFLEDNHQCQGVLPAGSVLSSHRTLDLELVREGPRVLNTSGLLSSVSRNGNTTTLDNNGIETTSDVCVPARISVKDAVSLWSNPEKESSRNGYTSGGKTVSSWDNNPQCLDGGEAADVDFEKHLKKAVFQRHGDSLRFFITHNDSGVVSDNEHSDGNNAPSSLESYVDPVTGKPTDWKAETIISGKNSGNPKHASKPTDRHVGILAKVLDLTLSRAGGNNKALAASLLSPFSSKHNKSANDRQSRRPRPPINRWDNIHVRSSQNHSASRPSAVEHVHQTAHTGQGGCSTAPALPPRQASVVQQQQQHLQQVDQNIAFSDDGFLDSFKPSTAFVDPRNVNHCVTPRNRKEEDLSDRYAHKGCSEGDVHFSIPPQPVNHPQGGVLHLDPENYKSGCVTDRSYLLHEPDNSKSNHSDSSSRQRHASALTNPNPNTVTYAPEDRSGIFASSITFDTEEGHPLRGNLPLLSPSLSTSAPCPLPDPSRLVAGFSDRQENYSALASRVGTLWPEQCRPTPSANTRADLEISSARLARRYVPDQYNSRAVSDERVSTPPPPLPARAASQGLSESQHSDLSSSHSLTYKQKIKRDNFTRISRVELKHTGGDNSLSEQSKHVRGHGDLIPFDGTCRVGRDGGFPEFTNTVNHCLHAENALSNGQAFSIPASVVVDTARSSTGEGTYQHSLREQCKKNQLWNLYAFDIKDNPWLRERLTPGNNLSRDEPPVSCLGVTTPSARSGDEQAVINVKGLQQAKPPLKITPRQKFEILHSRVSEKVATNLRRQKQIRPELQGEETDQSDGNFNKEGPDIEVVNSPSNCFDHVIASTLSPQVFDLHKESPRARFERARAARSRGVPITTVADTCSADGTDTAVKLNRSCDDLDTETFGAGSRPGSDTSFLVNKALLQRSQSHVHSFRSTGQGLAPPVPPKPILRHTVKSSYLGPLQRSSSEGHFVGVGIFNGEQNCESACLSHSFIHSSSSNNKSQEGPSFISHQCLPTDCYTKDSLIFENQLGGNTSPPARIPAAFSNQCSEEPAPVSATQIQCDTPRRVAFSLPAAETLAPRSAEQQQVHSTRQSEAVPDDTGTGTWHWNGSLTTGLNRHAGGGETNQRLAAETPPGILQREGQHQQSFTGAQVGGACDSRISAGSQQLRDVCEGSSPPIKGFELSFPSAVAQSEGLTVNEDIITNLDPCNQGQQSCAPGQEGSLSDPRTAGSSQLCEPQKGSMAKKMSPGSVSSSGYESEINSTANSQFRVCNDTGNISDNNRNRFGVDEVKAQTLSTVQQLRLRFGHNPNRGVEQFVASSRGSTSNSVKVNKDISSELPVKKKSGSFQFYERESLGILLGRNTDCNGANVNITGELYKDNLGTKRSVHQEGEHHNHQPESRHQRIHRSGVSQRYSPRDKVQNKKLLEKVSRSMHGIIHDLKPGSYDISRHSPPKHHKSCQHKTHKKKTLRESPSKPGASSGRCASRSASASSECSVCAEDAAVSANFRTNHKQVCDLKADTNNNLKASCDSPEHIQSTLSFIRKAPRALQHVNVNVSNDIIDNADTYSVNTASRHQLSNSDQRQFFPTGFFSQDEAAMLASKGLRIYESGEGYIAMRSPVKSPLHKSMSAPQFGWEGAHYLIMPTVVEPFSPNTSSSAIDSATNGANRQSGTGYDKENNANYQSQTNTLLTHRSISDSGTSRRCSTSRFDDGVDASNFFTGHRSDGDEYDDELSSFNDISYSNDDDNNNNNAYLPMGGRKLSARHRAMSVDVLYKERPSSPLDSDSVPLVPGHRQVCNPLDSDIDKGGRGYVEWKTCSGWVGKVDMRNAPNGRNSRGYVEWETIWTAAAPWGSGAKEDEEHVYDVIAENSSTCSTEEGLSKEVDKRGEEETGVKDTKGSVELNMMAAAITTKEIPPALPERTYINKIKNSRTNSDNSSASSTPGHKCQNHHNPNCRKHHHHHHHHHHHSHNHHHRNHNHRHHNHHGSHQQDNQQKHPIQQQQGPPQRPAKPSNLSISSQQQQQPQQHQSPSTAVSSPLSTPTKHKAAVPASKPPPKPPRQPHQPVHPAASAPHQHQQHQQSQPVSSHSPEPHTEAAQAIVATTSGSNSLAVSENYSEVHKLKGYKFTSLLTTAESESPVPRLLVRPTPDPNAIYSENYWHLGPAVAPQARATVWQPGDVLDYIDGLHDSMSPKRRENIYILLNNKKTRAKFSESLEIESRLLSKGLLSPSPSSSMSASSSSPLPPTSSSSSVVMSHLPESGGLVAQPTEVKPMTSPATSAANKSEKATAVSSASMSVATTTPVRIVRRKGATAPVSSTYV